jgi:NRPS condensation-like uncharacterized protein
MARTLPFTPIEAATYHLDEALGPWHIQWEFRTTATIDPGRLEAATVTAMHHHPMARARRRTAATTGAAYEWVIRDDPDPPAVTVADDGTDLRTLRNRCYGQPFDLTAEAPFRLVVQRGGGIDGGDRLLVPTSHVAADGVGLHRLLRTLLTAYRGEEPAPGGPSLTQSRSLLDEMAPDGLRDVADAIVEAWRQSREGIDSPTDIAREGGSEREGWGYTRRSLDPETTARLLADRPDGVSVNDVLLAALHLTVAAWNTDHGVDSDTLGVMMPVNLRPDDWFYEVVAMYTLFQSVRTDAAARAEPADTVAQVAGRTTRLKQRDRPAALFEALTMLDELPSGLERRLAGLLDGPGSRFTDTVLLTNLGDLPTVPSFGADTTERVQFSAPAWDAVPVSFCALTTDRLELSTRYLLAAFDAGAAERLTDRYVEEIEQLVDRLPALSTD